MRKLDRKTLDEIGIALVKADTVRSREIDEIAGNPALFEGVRSKIRQSVEVKPKRIVPTWVLSSSVAGIIMMAAAVSAWVLIKSEPLDVVVQPVVVDTPRVHAPTTSSKPDSVAPSALPRAVVPIRAEKISSRPSPGLTRRKQPEAQQAQYEGEFYALSYAGDPNETERGGRIVRVDIPRSTLFAMGVNVPLENGPDTVKADLLIGTDGVTRAIRIVK